MFKAELNRNVIVCKFTINDKKNWVGWFLDEQLSYQEARTT